ARAMAPSNGRALGVAKVRRMAIGAAAIKTDRKLDVIEAEMLMRQIAIDPNVEYVEVDQFVRPLFVPNDSFFSSDQDVLGSGAGGIRATEAWDITNGSGEVIAIIDSGITPHSD